MRIISQNSKIDAPYEVVALRVCDGTITMCMVGEAGKGSVLSKEGHGYATPGIHWDYAKSGY